MWEPADLARTRSGLGDVWVTGATSLLVNVQSQRKEAPQERRSPVSARQHIEKTFRVVQPPGRPPIESVDFQRRVAPLLNKLGCNAGAWHGNRGRPVACSCSRLLQSHAI